MKRKSAACGFFVIFLWGCSNIFAPPTEADVPVISDKWPSLTLAELQQGHRLYIRNCGGCHRLYSPLDHTEEEWHQLLPEMIGDANLGEAEQDLIFKYLVAVIKKKSQTAKANSP